MPSIYLFLEGSPFRVKITGDMVSDESSDGPQATPIAPGLEPIMEESDEEDRTTSEPNMKQRKKVKKKKHRKGSGGVQMMPILVMNPNYTQTNTEQMPTFRPGRDGQVPYQLAFAPMAMQRPKKANNKGHTVSFNSNVDVSPHPSNTAIVQSNKMMTFSSLRQMGRKHHRSSSVPSPLPVEGSFTGHASVDVNTVTKHSKVVKRSIMKRSTSDSETVKK